MTKRTFLQTIGAGMPTLKLMLTDALTGGPPTAVPDEPVSAKFTPIDCSQHFTASPADLGPRERAKRLSVKSSEDGLIRVPTGNQNFRGIPFVLGPDDVQGKSWVALSRRQNTWSASSVEIPVGRKACFVCLAQFSDWYEDETPLEKIGHHLADVVMAYEDGTEHIHPIRFRFEVNTLSYNWGNLCFAAVPHRPEVPSKLTDQLKNATLWGNLQSGVWDSHYPRYPNLDYFGTLWVCALRNPSADRKIRALRLEAKSDDQLMICGITAYHGRQNPLRYERLNLYQIKLPMPAQKEHRWEVGVDLGVVARTFQLPLFEADSWLSSPTIGLGERQGPSQDAYLYAEVSASPDATLTLRNAGTASRFEFDLGAAVPGQELEARPQGALVEILEARKVWVHAKVMDADTGRPTPVRLAFRSKEGRYIPPYGHRTEINSSWFQDYGADLKVMDSSFAYVDGTFQVELPVGEVYLEMTKGFEYEPVRKKLEIRPDQRELNLEIKRITDFRSKNWVCADVHVHFLSPTTAVLEGQAEGLNLINLLAAQWGDLFTNVGDLPHPPLTSSDGDMIVRVGTENRQHILGHLGLLGGRESVFPMSASGPEESYIGGPLWNSLSQWADACRAREGLVVGVHFPYPTGELAADIVLGKIDAVELYPPDVGEQFRSPEFRDWYRYLNCGYRLPAVSGTDKMGAFVAAGACRGYAYLGQDEFSFANWAKAVRSGNTFMTSGPLLSFHVDGRSPGEEITLRTGRGRVEVSAEAKCATPIHCLEIVRNGEVVASREDSGGVRELTLRETLEVSGPGWLAARCESHFSYLRLGVAAHTSPVYLQVPGRDLFSAPVAAYILTLIDGAQTWVKDLATRPDAERYTRVLEVFNDARQQLHRRMHQHGIGH